MSSQYVGAVDQGTTGTRFIVFTHEGTPVSAAYEAHRQIYPKPGWVEHDPIEIWTKTQGVIRAGLIQSRLPPHALAALGVTNQRETTIMWNRQTGQPVYNAIVWQDTRTRDTCQRIIDDGFEPTIKERTGLVSAPYFSGPKIKWLLDNVSGVREQALQSEVLFGTVDTWLIWWLTGGPGGGAHVTDYTNASRTMLLNLQTLDWDEQIIDYFGIPRTCLPAVRPSSAQSAYGVTAEDGPVGAEVPVCGDLGDQQAALVGQTCYSLGEAKNTYGTGSFLLLNTGLHPVASKSGLLTTAAYGLKKGKCSYALEGSIAITGAAIQWLRDSLGLIHHAAETEEIAGSVADAGGIYFVPAFSGLFAPHWDMGARGVIVGLTGYTTKAHLVRATLEAICFQTREVVVAMHQDSGIRLTALKVDGGAAKNNLLMQLQADILGVPVIRPTVTETTALGAAYAAGLAVGFWKDLNDLRAHWGCDRRFEPSWSESRREDAYRGWLRAVDRARGWIEQH